MGLTRSFVGGTVLFLRFCFVFLLFLDQGGCERGFPARCTAPGVKANRTAWKLSESCETSVEWTNVFLRLGGRRGSVFGPADRLGAGKSLSSGLVVRYLVDPASSHMLVSKIKPCMSKYKLLYGETADGSLKQLLFP